MRSFTEPPGLKYSSFTSTVASVTPSVTRWSLTSGVSPTRSTIDSAYFMPCSFLWWSAPNSERMPPAQYRITGASRSGAAASICCSM